MADDDKSVPTTTVIIKRDSGNALGIASFVFGVIGIFVLSPVFVPLAVLLGIIAVIKKQLVWGILGLVCAVIGFVTSPILMGMIAGLTILSNVPQIQTTQGSNEVIRRELPIENQRPQLEAQPARQAATYKPPDAAMSYATTPSKRELLHPDFDCARARTYAEVAICTNSLLADADGRLGRIYRALRHSLSESDSQALKKQQLRWLRQRDIALKNECSAGGTLDIDCALRLWQDRITALESMRSQVP